VRAPLTVGGRRSKASIRTRSIVPGFALSWPSSFRASRDGAARLLTWVTDELRQDASTGEMIYDCFAQVAHLSQAFTLEPGDVIATGTPAGVGALRQPFPQGLLKVGDTVRVEIERIGALTNTVIDEPEGYVAPADAVPARSLEGMV
jgi:2-keto-4-pentenoate hydratase/2-oxohepta-3-ene-1,7-dioic acid hydratase in catechol pathway